MAPVPHTPQNRQLLSTTRIGAECGLYEGDGFRKVFGAMPHRNFHHHHHHHHYHHHHLFAQSTDILLCQIFDMKITNATKTGGNGDREEAWVRGEGWEEREWRMEGREGKKQQVWQGGEERGQGG